MSADRRPREVDTTSRAARIAQVVSAGVLAVLSVAILITTHRVQLEIVGISWPLGLVIGAVFQVLACTFLWASTGSRLPQLVLAALWGLLAMPFLTRGVGGGVLMPAEIGGVAQYQGWVVQLLGIGIPLLFAAAQTVSRLRSIRPEGGDVGAAAGEGPASRRG